MIFIGQCLHNTRSKQAKPPSSIFYHSVLSVPTPQNSRNQRLPVGAGLHVADVHGDGDAAEVADATELLLCAVWVAHGHEPHDLVQLIHCLQWPHTACQYCTLQSTNTNGLLHRHSQIHHRWTLLARIHPILDGAGKAIPNSDRDRQGYTQFWLGQARLYPILTGTGKAIPKSDLDRQGYTQFWQRQARLYLILTGTGKATPNSDLDRQGYTQFWLGQARLHCEG